MDGDNKPNERSQITDRNLTARSRVSNGRRLFIDGVDARSAIARRFRDINAEILSDLGGPENTSEGERQLARRCAALSVEAERMEAALVSGDDFDTEKFCLLTNGLGRALSRIGLKRRPRDVTPALAEYIESGGAQ